MKKLTVSLGLSATLLAACAVDPATEESIDIDTVEQAYGEAACGTTSPSAPNGGQNYGAPSSCVSSTSPNSLYSNTGCATSYILKTDNPSGITAATAVATYGGAAPGNLADCGELTVDMTVYRGGGLSPLVDTAHGVWKFRATPPYDGYCDGPKVAFTSFSTAGAGWSVVARAYQDRTPFDLYRTVKVAMGTSSTCSP